MSRLPNRTWRAFWHEVARLRQQQGLSLDGLAEKAGVSRDTLINVEQGK